MTPDADVFPSAPTTSAALSLSTRSPPPMLTGKGFSADERDAISRKHLQKKMTSHHQSPKMLRYFLCLSSARLEHRGRPPTQVNFAFYPQKKKISIKTFTPSTVVRS